MRAWKNAVAIMSATCMSLVIGQVHAGARHWRGSDSESPTLASVDANWVDDSGNPAPAPTADDDVFLEAKSLDKPLTWDIPTGVHSWTQTADYAGTVTFLTGRDAIGKGTAYEAVGEKQSEEDADKWFFVRGDVSLQGGVWKHRANPNFNSSDVACKDGLGIWRLLVKVGGNMTVGASAAIDVSDCGFPASTGPGFDSVKRFHSASHGGSGIKMSNLPPVCYGSVKRPVCLGSGGQSSGAGGAVWLEVAGALSIDGAIHADALGLTSTGAKVDYYAGSGGSVLLMASSLSVGEVGEVTANGGPVTASCPGGGGRVAVVLKGAGESLAAAGLARVQASSAGFHGTVYVETESDAGNGTLVVRGFTRTQADLDNWRNNRHSTQFNDPSQDYVFSEIRLEDGAVMGLYENVTVQAQRLTTVESSNLKQFAFYGGKLQLPEGTTVTNVALRVYNEGEIFGFAEGAGQDVFLGAGVELRTDVPLSFPADLSLSDGARVCHSANGNGASYLVDLTVEGNLTIGADSGIDVVGLGFAKNKGEGTGNLGVSSIVNGGGSHGGVAGNSGTAVCYGSPLEPVENGAGVNRGTMTSVDPSYCGGGIAKLTVHGNLMVDGFIRADGKGSSYCAGAGGSVNIRTATLSGTGMVTANGGMAATGNCSSPGGGGRVAVRLTNAGASFASSPRILARGGVANESAKQAAGAGTVYLQTGDQAENKGTIVIDNDGYVPYQTACLTQFGSNVSVSNIGSIRLCNKGQLQLNAEVSLALAGDWINESVPFVAASGSEVILAGMADAMVSGTNTFYNLTCATPGKRLVFGTAEAGSLLKIAPNGKLMLTGTKESRISLDSADGSGTWKIAIQPDAKQQLECLNVKNSDATDGVTPLIASDSVEPFEGANPGWQIVGSIKPGEEILWTGEAGTSWSDPGNWNRGRLPLVTDVVIVPVTNNAPVLSENLTINSMLIRGVLNLNGFNLTVTNAFACSGTLSCRGSEMLTLSGDVDFAGARMSKAPTAVVLNGMGSRSMNFGSLSFEKVLFSGAFNASVDGGLSARALQIVPTASMSLSFADQVCLEVGELLVSGSTQASVTLQATVGKWNLVVTGSSLVCGVNVLNSNASFGIPITAYAPSQNLGGNTNWTFSPSGVLSWIGGETGDFFEASNWSGGAVPGASDVASIPSGASVNAATAVSVGALVLEGTLTAREGITVNGTVRVAEGGVLTLDKPSIVNGTLTLLSGSLLTHSANGSTEAYKIDITVSGDVMVAAEARIDVTARGYAPLCGPGAAVRLNTGAAHGAGTRLYTEWNPDAIKPAYGSVFAPVTLGSGGQGNSGTASSGGGAVKIVTSGRLTLDGVIAADGEVNYACPFSAGAGGSVYLIAESFAGGGLVSAVGGTTTNGGSGSGGRISLVQTGAGGWRDDFTALITAHGGYATGGAVPVVNGWGGTIYRQTAEEGEAAGTIYIDEGYSGAKMLPKERATELTATGSGAEDAKAFADVKVALLPGATLDLVGDFKFCDMELPSTARLFLNGHTVQLSSRVHRKRRGWKGSVIEDGGRIVWPAGFAIIIR